MHSKDCPYCRLARKTGGLYCSMYDVDMQSLDSGVFLINTDKFEECEWHQTRLVMNFNLDDDQPYQVDSREHMVKPDRYLLINEGQWFRTAASYSKPARMLSVAFKVGLAEEMYTSMTHDHRYLLDHHNRKQAPLYIFDKTYPLDNFLHNVGITLSDSQINLQGEQLAEYLEGILRHVLITQTGIQRGINRIGSAKLSTRQEIYRRLSWTTEYIEDNLASALSTEILAQHACMSLYHFKRLFKEVHGIAPYQYIKSLRLRRANKLLTDGESVAFTCKAVGWDDVSAFIRLYKEKYRVTPGKVREIKENSTFD